MSKFFANVNTLNDLKKSFHALALRFHPDTGSPEADGRIMAEINAEYSARFEVLKKEQNTAAEANPSGSVKATTEAPEEFIEIISHLLKLDGLKVELCGSWLWIGGDTMKHKETLKAAGCRWAASKKLWSWHHQEDGSHYFRGKKSMAEIRIKYGSTSFGASGSSAVLLAE